MKGSTVKHKKKPGRIGQQRPNEVLVQARVQAIAPAACVAATHQPSDKGDGQSWEVRWYQNTERLADLLQQGVARDQVNQVLWDEACREQDTIGVRIHMRVTLCTSCLFNAFQWHTGANQLRLVMMPALLTGNGAFLVVSNRKTETAGLIAPFPPDIEEKDILKTLRDSQLYPIRLKGEGEA